MVQLRAKTTFNRRKIEKHFKDKSIRSLGHAGGAINLTARRSIRRTKEKPSRPGTPPHTRRGQLKKALRYKVERHQEKVVIGPTRSGISTIGATHEHGRRRKIPNPRRRVRKIGDGGEIAIGRPSGKLTKRTRLGTVFVTYTKLRTHSQVARANRINRLLYGPEEIIVGRYPKRPLMGPALEKVKDRLPKLWGTSVK
ncbi:MAG: hypothetical protein PVH19_15055 [Planctomycetia bacterium]|jgi:hypothetical protein